MRALFGSWRSATGVALNFRIQGAAEAVAEYEICAAWPDRWRLMFHLDPKQEVWPGHPRHHIQLASPNEQPSLPPFLPWRIPFGEVQPERLLEYLVTYVA